MTKEIAEVFAHTAGISSLVPVLLGIFYFKNLSVFYKFMLASVAASLLFDAFSFVCVEYSLEFCSLKAYYSPIAILIAGMAFRHLLKINSLKTRLFDLVLIILLGVAMYFCISKHGASITNYPSATLEHLYIIGFSTVLIMYYLIFKQEITRSERPIIVVLSANIIHFATIVSIFIFFKSLSSDDIMNLYLVKWILFILFNLVIAYVFYHVGRGKWKVT